MNLIQSAQSNTASCPFSQAVGLGNLLIVVVTAPSLVVRFGCADDLHNVYLTTGLRQTTFAGQDISSQVFFTRSKSAAANSVTPSSVGGSVDEIIVHEIGGANTLDLAAYAVGVGTALDSGPITTTRKNEFLFGYGAHNGALVSVVGAGWTQAQVVGSRILTQYQLATNVGTFNSTQTGNTGKGGTLVWIEEILSFYNADFEVGQLYPQNIGYPTPVQPGGQGTPVTDPKQQIGPTTNTKPDLLFPINEFSGRFRPACGHSINSYEVKKAAVGLVASALICCPICLYIVHVVTPYDLIHTQPFEYIVG